ncbi:hypothetical protein PABG_12135 [Paracoccidioides brasiliensis Pb03]|nr:hypothetical protein PABG_12135 [Paracoccidioides brasiliensis Pb03]
MDESIPGRQPEGQEDGPPYWHNMGPHGTLISLALMLGDAKYLLRNAKKPGLEQRHRQQPSSSSNRQPSTSSWVHLLHELRPPGPTVVRTDSPAFASNFHHFNDSVLLLVFDPV